MARYIRFVVYQRVDGEPRRVGLFTAAYSLGQGDDLSRHDRHHLCAILAWFEAELAIPPFEAVPRRSVFWYKDVGPYAQRMWELAAFLDEHGFTTEMIVRRSVGRVFYEDAQQVAASPCRIRR